MKKLSTMDFYHLIHVAISLQCEEREPIAMEYRASGAQPYLRTRKMQISELNTSPGTGFLYVHIYMYPMGHGTLYVQLNANITYQKVHAHVVFN